MTDKTNKLSHRFMFERSVDDLTNIVDTLDTNDFSESDITRLEKLILKIYSTRVCSYCSHERRYCACVP